MQHIRPFIFLAFVGLFLLTSSAVVFYAFGYRFSFERGIFIYTGSISIKSNPKNVTLRVDNELIPEKKLGLLNDSILISGLTPGEYFIEVSADGYLPWSKKAIVQSGLSTEFWNVLLTKTDTQPTVIPNIQNTLKMFPAPDENLFAVARTTLENELAVDTLDISNNTSEQVFSLPQAVLPSDGENIEWSPDNRKLIIPLNQDDKRSYFIVDVKDKQVASLPSPAMTELPIHNPRWDSTTRNSLFYLAGSILYRANTESTDPALFVRDHIRAYDISGSNIYYLDDNGIIYRVPANQFGTNPTQITTTTIDTDPSSLYTLIVYNDQKITLREHTTGKLWIYNQLSASETILKPLAENGVRGVQFSNDGKKLLFFTDTEIAVYFTIPWEAQPIREANTTLQIARFSSTIKNIQWTKDYEHVLFTTNGSAKIIELDNRDHRNMAEIVTFSSPLIQALSRFEDDRVYFIQAGSISFIDFPPSQKLFSF